MDKSEQYDYIFKEVNTRLQKLYKGGIDEQIVGRIRYEMDELSKCYDLDIIIKVAEAIKTKKAKGDLYLARSSQNNSLILYLLGLGSVNPLPRHTYCPKCHAFYWGNKKTDLCECCNELLQEDGYDLPFEILLDDIKNKGLLFKFSVTDSSKFVGLPIRTFQSDLIRLAKELGFTQEEIEKNNVTYEDTEMIMKYLSLPYDKEELSFYTEKYKKKFICDHNPYIGIEDLGTTLIGDLFNIYFDCYNSFEDFAKLVAMLHGSGVIEANHLYVCDFLINDLIEDAIATRDDLYNLLVKSNLSKDDALFICREKTLRNKGDLFNLSEAKLKEANVDEKYINFIRHISYIFYKGQAIANFRLEIKIAKIYLEEPLRYYLAYFRINKDKLSNIDEVFDFIEAISKAKSTDMKDIYLAATDLMERGYNPKTLIKKALNG